VSLLARRPDRWSELAIWQDVEFGSYAADLPLWRELASAAAGTVLELGAGSGRVALALAREGLEVIAIEGEPELAEELRARAAGLPVTVITADITALDGLPGDRGAAGARLAIAPLQVIQLLTDHERASLLALLATGLRSGERCAFALVDEATLAPAEAIAQPRPEMREIEGWVYSSEPLWVQVSDQVLRMRRLRERVAPGGDLVRRVHDDVLRRLSAGQLEAEAEAAGLRPAGRRAIASGADEAGSITVVLEAP
jgi:SAM-dependent methyltransferase